jgi:hypothetical protein
VHIPVSVAVVVVVVVLEGGLSRGSKRARALRFGWQLNQSMVVVPVVLVVVVVEVVVVVVVVVVEGVVILERYHLEHAFGEHHGMRTNNGAHQDDWTHSIPSH